MAIIREGSERISHNYHYDPYQPITSALMTFIIIDHCGDPSGDNERRRAARWMGGICGEMGGGANSGSLEEHRLHAAKRLNLAPRQ